MINLSLVQFDQVSLLFFVFSAAGLIRERKIIPFLLVAFGLLLNGVFGAVLLAGLILWHRMDSRFPKWVQLKDAMGFLLILIGAIVPSPYQELSLLLGVLFVSFSFGKGGLGIIPALLLLRQYVPHPDPLEPVFIGAGIFWLSVEVVRWAKAKKAELILAISEVVCSLVILSGMKEIVARLLDEPNLLIFASAVLLFVLVLAVWILWKGPNFWSFGQKMKLSLARSLVLGKRFISNVQPWSKALKEPDTLQLETVFDSLFFGVIATLLVLGGFVLLSRGGFN